MSNPWRRRRDSRQLATESSFYDVYNNLAEAYDEEMIKDWTESLNSLLVFAAIFSAVLTGFIIESIKMIHEDPQDITVDILIALTNQLANGSFTGYTKPKFEAPAYSIIVNCLFFASIGSSLFAALAAVVALQWVNQYDARLDSADPEKLALVREARLMGVYKWKMNEIIGGLPILLYISVFLFFAGMVEWMWNIHRVVGGIVLAGAASAIGFYIVTTLIAAISPGSPYRSRLSQWIANGLRWLIAIFKRCVSISHGDQNSLRSIHDHILDWFPDTSKWENSVIQKADLQISAVMWAVKNVNQSPQFYRRLLHIAKYASQLSIKDDRDAAELRSIPWRDVFHTIRVQIANKPVGAISTVIRDVVMFLECIAEHPRFGMNDEETEVPFYDPMFTDAENEAKAMVYLWRSSKAKESFTNWWKGFFSGAEGVSHSQHILAFAIEQLAYFIHSDGRTDLTTQYLSILSAAIPIQPTSPPESLLSDHTLRSVLRAIHAVAFNDKTGVCWSESTRSWAFGARPSGNILSAVENCHNAVLSQYLAHLWHVNSEAKGEEIVWRIHRMLFYRFIVLVAETDDSRWGFSTPEEFIMDVQRSPLYNNEIGTLKDVSVARSFTCLLFSQWGHNYEITPLIHDLMRGFLSFRLRFPAQSPLWGVRASFEQMEALNQLYYQYLGEQGEFTEFLRSYLEFQISTDWPSYAVDIIRRCNDLITSRCTQEKRTVIVNLIASNSLPSDLPYSGRYTRVPKVMDPCLSLITARAQGKPFIGKMPTESEIVELGFGWIVALEYWCNTFKGFNSDKEGELVRDGLLSRNESVQMVIVKSSSTNEALKSTIQEMLSNTTERNELLELYTACRRASWFASFLEANNAWTVGLDLCEQSPLSVRTTPLLSVLSPLMANEASWHKLAKVLTDSLASNLHELPERLVPCLIIALQAVVESYPDPLEMLPKAESQLGEALEELIVEGIAFMLMGQDEEESPVEIEGRVAAKVI